MNHYLARAVCDWRWFFQSAKAEMGIASSWEPLAYIAQCGGVIATKQGGGEERRLAAARRHARIEAALRLMPPDAVHLVRLTCEEQTHTLRLAFGELGNVAHLSECARRAHRASQTKRGLAPWLDRLAWRCVQGRATSGALNAIADIRRGCEVVMNDPRNEYVKALGRVG